jgi:hypothetical protein
MPHFRFPIAAAMAAILIAGVGLAAMKNPTELWAGTIFTLAWVALLVGLLGAVLRRGRERAAWLGFTLFGWSYVLVCIVPPLRAEVRNRLLTRPLLIAVDEVSHATDDYIDSLMPGKDQSTRWAVARQVRRYYHTIGDGLMALSLAVIGAVTGRSIAGHGSAGRDGGPVGTGAKVLEEC